MIEFQLAATSTAKSPFKTSRFHSFTTDPFTNMFKTAATKIAHNSTLPALAGNKDLRPLQDLITAEKAVIISSVSIHIIEP